MAKRTLVFVSLVVALGVAAVSAAYGAGVTTPTSNFSAIDSGVVEVKGKFCPIVIDCIKGKVGKCHYSKWRHRCVCSCDFSRSKPCSPNFRVDTKDGREGCFRRARQRGSRPAPSCPRG